MNLVGVELNNKEAVIVLMSLNDGLFNVKECRTRGIELRDPENAEGIQAFQFQFKKIVEDYKIDTVVIKQRPMRGKFAGSANSFKMEAAIQLIDGINVELVANKDIKDTLKENPLGYTMKDLELRQFQEQAFNAAYTFALNQN
ncbi:DUF3010 family protein [Psychrosphaera ytuae]|uniref:DUF3010 family protein n=1 Tax=Psychrosphaera ytuae TaxID=2820710 RepID=A0A975HIL4_9GAMM|nr:DUF3010 family protein [Psychrosphaera ytuae]QTH64347.1 DUF3010 family protein [Psychrosphaera ytuae]